MLAVGSTACLTVLTSLSGCRGIEQSPSARPALRESGTDEHDASASRTNSSKHTSADAKWFGRVVGTVADCDGDGRSDYAVGLAWLHDGVGAIRFFSSKDGSPIFEVVGRKAMDMLGGKSIWRLADIDGDKLDDVAVGLGRAGGPAAVISVGQRKILFEVDAQADMLIVCRDLDGDRTPDLIECRQGTVAVFSGRNGEAIHDPLLSKLDCLVPVRVRTGSGAMRVLGLLRTADNSISLYDCSASLEQPMQSISYGRPDAPSVPAPREASRAATLCMTDFDLDGVPDLVQFERVNHPRGDTDAYSTALAVRGSRARGLAFERRWDSDLDSPPCIAKCVAMPGDLNADGIPDLVFGNPNNFEFPGGVRAISGKDGSEIWKVPPGGGMTWTLPPGVSLDVLEDGDGDGVADIVVGCGSFSYDSLQGDGGVLLILSGRSGKELRRLEEADVPYELK